MDVSCFVANGVLSNLDFFNKKIIDPHVVGTIALKMRSISCNAGYKLYKKGDLSHQIYIQRTGVADQYVKKGKNKEKKIIHTLERGDVVGEYAIIQKRRTCTVQCQTWCEF